MWEFVRTIVPWGIAAIALTISFLGNIDSIRPRWEMSLSVTKQPFELWSRGNDPIEVEIAFTNDGNRAAIVSRLNVSVSDKLPTRDGPSAQAVVEPQDFAPLVVEPGEAVLQRYQFGRPSRLFETHPVYSQLNVDFIMPGRPLAHFTHRFVDYSIVPAGSDLEHRKGYTNIGQAQIGDTDKVGSYWLPDDFALGQPVTMVGEVRWFVH